MNPYPETSEIIDLDSDITSDKEIAKQIRTLMLLMHLIQYIKENLSTNKGSLREGGRKQQPDAPIYNNPIIQ
jgi:hypothetical protein